MTDLYLQAMMHGDLLGIKKTELIKKLNIFQDKWDREIDLYITDQLKNEPSDPQQDLFHSPQTKKVKLKAELEETLKFSELSHHIELAFEYLNSSGESPLITIFTQPDQSDILNESKNFQDILKIEEESLNSIVKFGMESFSQGLFAESMAIFILLATLNPENAGYWYRAGIAADKQEQYELAIKFYSAAATLEPDLIGPKAFLVDCYLESKKLSEAEVAYKLAIESAAKNSHNSWNEFLSKLETKIQAAIDGGI